MSANNPPYTQPLGRSASLNIVLRKDTSGQTRGRQRALPSSGHEGRGEGANAEVDGPEKRWPVEVQAGACADGYIEF